MRRELTIGRVARLAGVNVETIRYYQRRGLLIEPEKPWGAYRRYPEEIVKQIHFIKRTQALGFTLEEVRDFLHLSGANACAAARGLAACKVDLINRKMADLAAMQRTLAALVTQCDSSQVDTTCPIIQALADE